MIDGTGKLKFAKRAARYNEFRCNTYGFLSTDLERILHFRNENIENHTLLAAQTHIPHKWDKPARDR